MSRYNITRKNYNKKSYKKVNHKNVRIKEKNVIRYYFTEQKSTKSIHNLKLSKNTIQKVFGLLRDKFGEERVNDYKIYRDGNLELTVYQEGSNFCNRITENKIKDIAINNDNILVCHLNLKKVHNDKFSCKLKYDEVLDIIDVFFNVNDNIKIILKCKYENSPDFKTIKKLEDIGMKSKISECEKFWIELIVEASPLSNPQKVHEIVNLIHNFI